MERPQNRTQNDSPTGLRQTGRVGFRPRGPDRGPRSQSHWPLPRPGPPSAVRRQPAHGRDRIHIPPTVYTTISPSMAYWARSAERTDEKSDSAIVRDDKPEHVSDNEGADLHVPDRRRLEDRQVRDVVLRPEEIPSVVERVGRQGEHVLALQHEEGSSARPGRRTRSAPGCPGTPFAGRCVSARRCARATAAEVRARSEEDAAQQPEHVDRNHAALVAVCVRSSRSSSCSPSKATDPRTTATSATVPASLLWRAR